ncbi:MAG: hypothetical protein KatS3mg130_1065 [Candidatus Sumerlaea sp.]|uniref:Uncharacterized protein n=1 Tax=Sumerlaea chitinivorans TaxID=2250252 RepID=A0A2Z4YAC5_SUMC1|nr:hypothetical protein BRCON_2810 [Candidatus Sumerlaea chitinivorans]GIX44657.1 MAG: hypothetical protein KatS3mg130_1065 [Candidatus Sumerlaea sp.]
MESYRLAFGKKWTALLIHAALGMLVLSAPFLCKAAAPGAQPAPFLRLRGANLARAKWYVSPTLPPTASPDEITSKALATTPTLTLTTPPGGAITLFTIIEIPGQPTYGAEFVVGDVDGDDETFFNGVRIGATAGRGIGDTANSRLYYIPPSAMREGKNVLAIRLRGSFGRQQVALRREPITIGFVPVAPRITTESAKRSVTLFPDTSTIPESVATSAIGRRDPETSGGELVFRKRPSFGRFGLTLFDGLPALSEVSPTGLKMRAGPEFRVEVDSVREAQVAQTKTGPDIDGWHKRIVVTARASEQDVRYTVHWHLFYPGAIFTLREGKALVLRTSAGDKPLFAVQVADEELAAALGGTPDGSLTGYLVAPLTSKGVPAVVMVANGRATLLQDEQEVLLTVTRLPDASAEPRIYVFYPTGLRTVDLSGRLQTAFDVVRQAERGSEPVEALRRWLRIGLNEPVATDEYFMVRSPANAVRIYQVARFQSPTGGRLNPYLPLPPQLEFARRIGYPVGLPPTTSPGVLTFSGELLAATDGTSVTTRIARSRTPRTDDELWVWSYDLPIPPLAERALIARSSEENPLRALLNESLGDLPTTIAMSGVDALYKSRTQGFQAFSFLTPENREKLVANTRRIVPAYLQAGPLYGGREPLSGREFWWTYFLEGPYFDQYDYEWGNGLSLYGLYTACKYLGEWEWVAKNWTTVERLFSWFTVSDDWEWMRASNGLHGHGSGAGDCTNATYAGAIAYAKLARETGRAEEFAYGVYTAARAALPVLTRYLYNEFAEELNLKPNRTLVVGFHEGRGFLVGELDRYPWNVTSNLSGNGVQPEIFDLYVRFAPETLRDYERVFETAYPNWMDGKYVYPFPTIYRNNSGYITLPHLYLRARLKMAGQGMLEELVERARTNKHLWWLAPPVLAEVLSSQFELYVADWGKCAFLGGELTRIERRRLRAEIQFENRYPPDVVEVAVPRTPTKIELNAGPIPLPDLKQEKNLLKVRFRKPGRNTLTLYF